ncbi:MAG TPA: glutamate-5-semialdehyde dehydrogenase [Acidobacteriota bacterium]|nr:glutamate-5-semialdehyde dehydrogenase [Acidobacteriota bacterium]
MDRIEQLLSRAKQASYAAAVLSSSHKNEALTRFARLIEESREFLLEENRKDVEAQRGRISDSLFQRLELDRGKIDQLVTGLRDMAELADPVGRVLSRTLLDEGLVLEKLSVPLGVVAVIFESRPDVIPQILALILKSGNCALLKGGSEAKRSNRAFMQLVEKLNQDCPFLPPDWAQLLDSREDVQRLLAFPQYVDLVVPRGSNQLVRSIMKATQIPVLGHADGICHFYLHHSADFDQALKLVVDAKIQYPAACNALETLLVDAQAADGFLPLLARAAQEQDMPLRACSRSMKWLDQARPAQEEDWRTEYGDRTLAVRMVDSPQEAVRHINTYGSHHTDGILCRDEEVQEAFLASVDSAGVFANASLRFADGFRFGLGAELGISTSKTHARGPVGLEGLVIYKYKLRGQGQRVADYTGPKARPFVHRPL